MNRAESSNARNVDAKKTFMKPFFSFGRTRKLSSFIWIMREAFLSLRIEPETVHICSVHLYIHLCKNPDQVSRCSARSYADFQSFLLSKTVLTMPCYYKPCCFRHCLFSCWIHFLLRHLNRVLYLHLSYLFRTKQNQFPPFICCGVWMNLYWWSRLNCVISGTVIVVIVQTSRIYFWHLAETNSMKSWHGGCGWKRLNDGNISCLHRCLYTAQKYRMIAAETDLEWTR